MDSLNVKLIFTASVLEVRGLVKLGMFYVDYLAVSSWYIRLPEKLSIFVIMELVEVMATYAKRAISPNKLGFTSLRLRPASSAARTGY